MKRYVILKDDLEIEADSIIDTQTNTLYECNSSDMNKLCKILNEQNTKWQKLKEWVSFTQPKNINDEFISGVCSAYSYVIDKMQELEGEDE